jgi:epoxide hydrolase-like predicted phosphatase
MPDPAPTALLVDYGGVLTNPLPECLADWCERDDVDPAHFGDALRSWLADAGDAESHPVFDLERGRLTIPEFERELARRLRNRSGGPVQAPGLLRRMFAGFVGEPAMVAAVGRLRDAGVRTGLVSNSWGMEYPREGWERLFDAVVISGEVGMRKPEPAIYRHAAALLQVPVEQCVFVDDIRVNVRGAEAVGMTGVYHQSVGKTLAELGAIFGMPVGNQDGACHDSASVATSPTERRDNGGGGWPTG